MLHSVSLQSTGEFLFITDFLGLQNFYLELTKPTEFLLFMLNIHDG